MAQSKSTKRRPLEGVRVIDLTRIVAGPNCTRMLATMGAEVIRVEWNDDRALDLLRGVHPKAPGGKRDSLNRSGLFNNINTGKYGITLNMNMPQGQELFKRLIAKSTVLCENYSPGQMERWGLGYTEISAGLGWRFRKVELRVDGRNLTDQRPPVSESELGDAQYYILPARRFDVTLRGRW